MSNVAKVLLEIVGSRARVCEYKEINGEQYLDIALDHREAKTLMFIMKDVAKTVEKMSAGELLRIVIEKDDSGRPKK